MSGTKSAPPTFPSDVYLVHLDAAQLEAIERDASRGTYADPDHVPAPATFEEIRANVEKLGKPPPIPKELLEALHREIQRRIYEGSVYPELKFTKPLVDTAPLGPTGVMPPTFRPRLPPAEYATFGVPFTLRDLGWRMPEKKK